MLPRVGLRPDEQYRLEPFMWREVLSPVTAGTSALDPCGQQYDYVSSAL